VGANSPGIISPLGRCRIGFQPLSSFSPGPVGVAAKSGTLSYETVASLTRAGVGQSLCIGMGGDVVAGTDLVDALRVFERDERTEGIVLVGEVGGTAEEEAAEWIREYRRRVPNPKYVSPAHATPRTSQGQGRSPRSWRAAVRWRAKSWATMGRGVDGARPRQSRSGERWRMPGRSWRTIHRSLGPS
jgi:succinyl-CoA synthetase alpha subunit